MADPAPPQPMQPQDYPLAKAFDDLPNVFQVRIRLYKPVKHSTSTWLWPAACGLLAGLESYWVASKAKHTKEQLTWDLDTWIQRYGNRVHLFPYATFTQMPRQGSLDANRWQMRANPDAVANPRLPKVPKVPKDVAASERASIAITTLPRLPPPPTTILQPPTSLPPAWQNHSRGSGLIRWTPDLTSSQPAADNPPKSPEEEQEDLITLHQQIREDDRSIEELTKLLDEVMCRRENTLARIAKREEKERAGKDRKT